MKKEYLMLGAAAAVLGGIALVGTGVVQDYSSHVDKLTLGIVGIPKISLDQRSSAKVNIKISNPANQAFELNGLGIVKVTRVFIQDQTGKVYAQSTVNRERIDIPAFGYTILENVKIEGDTIELLTMVRNFANMKTAMEIEILGKKYVIEND